jgi:hypothetical protein
MKSSNVKQNGKEEQEKLRRARKAQNKNKSSKGSKSTLPLKSTPPNTLNASSPP